MLLVLASVLLVFAPFRPVLGTELCKDKEWYDDLVGKCRRCQTCVEKSWEVAPCTAFMNTMCVDLAEIGRSLEKNIKAGEKNINSGVEVIEDHHHNRHRWHEMEGRGVDEPSLARTLNLNEDTVSKDLFGGSYDQWDVLFVTILSLLFLFFIILVILGTVKYYGNPLQWDHSKMTRSRLFSRERLNTTEYMNNLATLDRRLAIDEIVEKKRRAIFEPQLLKENIYTDDVFVDISGLPRNLRNNHDYEEVDHTKCLLEMQGQN